MDHIIRGIMRYRVLKRAATVITFKAVKNKPVKTIFYACMDSRMIPTIFTETRIGDMFIVRNAGNIIPNYELIKDGMSLCSEASGLELACVIEQTRHIVVCGHGNCRAMHLLYNMDRKEEVAKRPTSPIRTWLSLHGKASLIKYREIEGDFSKPVVFANEYLQFLAYIDPEQKLNLEDKLSQINTLQQLLNVSSYKMLQERIKKKQLFLYAFWFDMSTGDVHFFNTRTERFMVIEETSYESIINDIERDLRQ